jgi:PhnB protein
MVNPIPDDYPRVSPYLVVEGAADAIRFYTEVLGATERARMSGLDDRVGHAELDFGGAVVMLADAFTEQGYLDPKAIGGTAVSLMLYVEDVDATFARAIEAGAKELSPVKDEFYGDRTGSIEDPFGHRWVIASHVEDVSHDELARRAEAAFGS